MKLPKPTATNLALGALGLFAFAHVFVWWAFAPKATGNTFFGQDHDPTSNL